MSERITKVQALDAIARVAKDRKLTPAEKLIVVQIILHLLDKPRRAWKSGDPEPLSYSGLSSLTGCSFATISSALRKAKGRHLARIRTERGMVRGCGGTIWGLLSASETKADYTSKNEEQTLRKALSDAVAREDYERAAQIRDMLAKLRS